MSYETSDGVLHINKVDASAGRRVKGMPLVLGISITSAVMLLGIALISFV